MIKTKTKNLKQHCRDTFTACMWGNFICPKNVSSCVLDKYNYFVASNNCNVINKINKTYAFYLFLIAFITVDAFQACRSCCCCAPAAALIGGKTMWICCHVIILIHFISNVLRKLVFCFLLLLLLIILLCEIYNRKNKTIVFNYFRIEINVA